MKRCKWCGVFVSQGVQPTWGANRWGIPIAQLLCPPCEVSWLDLTEANLERIHIETEPAP